MFRKQREDAQATVDSLQRLVNKQAATTFELKQARDAVAEIDARIAALEKRLVDFLAARQKTEP